MPRHSKSDGKKAGRDHTEEKLSNDHEEESMSQQEDFIHQDEVDAPMVTSGHDEVESAGSSSALRLEVSKALRKRLELSAREEGVTVEDLASELLAEGLVLRAWEIVERKSAMRGGGSPVQQHQQQQRQGNVRHGGGNHQGHHQGHNQGHKQGGGNKHGGGRMNKRHAAHAASLNLMEDKAAFLEYVRNQERKNTNR
ncbi:hypothetical protein EBZ80_14480 [bacterium]|nr:hypothetical protein [bacterium]